MENIDKPNIYLDVSGVLMPIEGKGLARHAEDFIEFIVENFEVYWLTTFAQDGDVSYVIDIIEQYSSRDLSEFLEDIHPTTWKKLKTEAINFDENFLWFDDNCRTAEKEVLKANGKYENWTEIDLDIDPDQLQLEIEELETKYL